MKTKTVKMIEDGEWDALVEETYGKPYKFQQQDGCKSSGTFEFTVPSPAEDLENETLPEIVNHEKMGVKFSSWLARDPKRPLKDEEDGGVDWKIRLWWDRNFYPEFQTLANDLHARGLLEAGEYTINIDW